MVCERVVDGVDINFDARDLIWTASTCTNPSCEVATTLNGNQCVVFDASVIQIG